MTISRVKTLGWSTNEELTSTQLNGLDLNPTYAVDKRAGQTDTLESVVSCSGSGRIVPTYEAGADADTTYALSSGIGILDASSGLTADRTYTLSTTGAVQGDRVIVLGNATYDVTVKVSSTTLLVVGAGDTGENQSRWGEFLYNGSTWVLLASSYAPQQTRTVFTSNGTYTTPADVYKLLVIGCGGGGGGGGGAGGSNAVTNTYGSAGGGGGGAACIGIAQVNTTPATAYTVTIGTAGTAGSAGANGATGGAGGDGGDGASTTFGSVVSFRGGQGGTAGPASIATPASNFQHVPGGGPVQSGAKASSYTASAANASPLGVRIPGEGGYGLSGSSTATTAAGGAYPWLSATTGGSGSTTPGAGAAQGANSGTTLGGGGGGGGGASAFGSGGAGGAGGAGNAAGNGSNGTAGSAGTAGSGGGGGGAGGNGSGSGGTGGAGGAGGAGLLVVIPVR